MTISDYVAVIEKAQRERDAMAVRLNKATKLIDEGNNAMGKLIDAETEIARLKEECFALAANQCHAGYGDDYGNHRCRKIDGLMTAIKDACDLLTERTQGSDARSPGHNARLLLERALSAVTNGERS